MQKTNFKLEHNLMIVGTITLLAIGAIVFSYVRAEQLARDGEYQNAIRHFPFKGSYYLGLADAYERQGESAKADSARRKAGLLGAGGD